MNFNRRAGVFRLIVFLMLCGCSAGNPTPSMGLPTFSGVENSSLSATTSAASTSANPTASPAPRIWGTKPLGVDQISVIFSEPQCVSYQFGTAQAVSNCTGSGTVVAIQMTGADRTGTQYTFIAGRVFSNKISVVAVELDRAENMPIPVSDSGFAVVLPGVRRAIALVPIDQFGNLVGQRYLFK